MLILLFATLVAASPRAESDPLTALTSRMDALEKQSLSMQATSAEAIQQLQDELRAAHSLIKELRADVAELNERLSFQRTYEGTPCACNLFETTNVTISSPSQFVNLTVGTPETGFINGVNINELAATSIINRGSQSIAGSLAVEALTIGQWNFSVSGDGDLVISSQLPSGNTRFEGDFSVTGFAALHSAKVTEGISAANVNASSITTNNITSNFVNSSSITTNFVNAVSILASKSYMLCDSGGKCISHTPRVQTISVPVTAGDSSQKASCPTGWSILAAFAPCGSKNTYLFELPIAISNVTTHTVTLSCPNGGVFIYGAPGFIICTNYN